MDHRRLEIPPVGSLEAFVAVAQAGSMRAAAQDLNLTISAVSHRVAVLERRLQATLFDRMDSGLKLNAKGETYLKRIRPLLRELEDAGNLVDEDQRKKLVIASLPVFHANWLTGRIGKFMAESAGYDIELVTFDDQSYRHADISIFPWFKSDLPPQGELLFEWEVAPVCRPDLIERLKLQQPADIERATLIDLKHRLASWPAWLAAAGLPRDFQHKSKWLLIDSDPLMTESAKQGLGVAMSSTFFAEYYSSQGLVYPFRVTKYLPGGMYIYHSNRNSEGYIISFINWIKDEIVKTNFINKKIIEND